MDQADQKVLSEKLIDASETVKNKKAVLSGVEIAAIRSIADSRRDYYRTIEKKIESYTYRNDDPVTQTCTMLNGKTMPVDKLDFIPPGHWGCKSYLVPNLKVWKNNPKIDRIKLNKSMKKEVTLWT